MKTANSRQIKIVFSQNENGLGFSLKIRAHLGGKLVEEVFWTILKIFLLDHFKKYSLVMGIPSE